MKLLGLKAMCAGWRLVLAGVAGSLQGLKAAVAHLCGVDLAGLETEVRDGIAAVQVYSCFVVGLCSCDVVLEATCQPSRTMTGQNTWTSTLGLKSTLQRDQLQ